jgi:uncharacterized protein YbbK (DUF523 family)
MNILVSACLLGLNCRYRGDGKYVEQVALLSQNHHLIPVCPEQMGGLPTPRAPVERMNGKAIDNTGKDVTAQFVKGADEVAKLAKMFGCKAAVLKSRSPSCGCGVIHDGTFSDGLINGNGFTAEKLLQEGIRVVSEDNLDDLCGL